MWNELTGLDFDLYDPEVDANNSIIAQPGVYVVCKKENVSVTELRVGIAREFLPGYQALYVGKTDVSLRKRIANQHFYDNARSSTLRRSVGNLLGYERFPLPGGRYRFVTEHEQALTLYMRTKFVIFYSLTEHTAEYEHMLILHYSPPLNHIL